MRMTCRVIESRFRSLIRASATAEEIAAAPPQSLHVYVSSLGLSSSLTSMDQLLVQRHVAILNL